MEQRPGLSLALVCGVRALLIVLLAASLGPGTRVMAQQPGPPPLMRGFRFDAGLLARGGRPGTAIFGFAADLTPPLLPGLLRLGLAGWSGGGRAGDSRRGRDISLLWLARSRPHGSAGLRLFAGAGPAIATERAREEKRPARLYPAAAGEAGVGLPLGIRDALTLELATGLLTAREAAPHVATRLGLRLGPGIRALLRGETPSRPVADNAQAVAPPPNLDDVAAVTGGLLVTSAAGGGLRLDASAFDSTGSLTRDAARQLGRAGGALFRLGLSPVHVEIYARDTATDSRARASQRAVAVARALARGGFAAPGIRLEVAVQPADTPAAGRVLAGVSCEPACAATARRPR